MPQPQAERFERFAIDGETAWRNLIASDASRWTMNPRDPGFAQTGHGRLAGGLALPRVDPKFTLGGDEVFFCIGSCFARNIEEHLMYRGIPVPSMDITFAGEPTRPNGFVSKYTSGSMLNELRWSLAGAPFPRSSIVEDDGGWRDLQLAAGAPALPLPEALERRRTVAANFGQLRRASVVIVTLGLVEAWHDREAGVDLNVAPTLWMTRRFPGRFSVCVTGYAENLEALHEIYALIRQYGPEGVRIVVTVSPVPMARTFTGEDVVVANAYSKAVLRAAAEDSARGCPDVQYYPSYEAIAVSDRALTYDPADELHVLDAAVAGVTADFLAVYGIARERPHPEFVEPHYLLANRDVYDAVIRREFSSGYAHWLAYGRAEGRPLMPG